MINSKIIKREFEVAFTKNAQPQWLRVLKYILLSVLIYFLWDTEWLWIVLSTLLILSLSIHFWYRYKTKGWTQSYRGWEYDNRGSS